MASILRVNTLTDASSNNSIATSVVFNGTAKAWINMNGSGTISNRDSSNISGITDNGTGDYTFSYSNNMDNANYCVTVCATDDGSTAGGTDGFAYGSWIRGSNSVVYATGSMRIQVGYPANNEAFDQSHVNFSLQGDLA